jgi:hypothetical protein
MALFLAFILLSGIALVLVFGIRTILELRVNPACNSRVPSHDPMYIRYVYIHLSVLILAYNTKLVYFCHPHPAVDVDRAEKKGCS